MATSLLSVLSGLSLVSFNQDGSIDNDTTNLNIQLHLQGEVESRRETDILIESELNRFFNEINPSTTKGVPTPMVVSHVANRIANGDLERSIELVSVVEDFLSRSTNFESRRGRNGGLFRKS